MGLNSLIRFCSSFGSSASFLHDSNILLPLSNSEQLPCLDLSEVALFIDLAMTNPKHLVQECRGYLSEQVQWQRGHQDGTQMEINHDFKRYKWI